MRSSITIAIPVFNEAPVIPELLKRLGPVITELEEAGFETNCLFVDDGSTDQTFSLIRAASRQDPRLGYIRLSRNFGHQAAINAAIDHAATDAIVILDGDLQDPPELIPKMVRLWKAGEAEVIYGQRQSRDGSPLKRLCYSVFYRVFNAIVDTPIPRDTGDFAMMDSSVYTRLRDFPERVRFLRGLRSWLGFRQIALQYHRPERVAGSAKYSLRDLYRLATDGIASFSVAPLRIAQFFAFVWFVATVGLVAWALSTQSISSLDPMFGLVVLLSFSMAMLFLCMYILGAYISRMYLETKHRPIYIAAEFSPAKSKSPSKLDNG
jgi:dolichol-phosphate mannosyltransferase